MQLIPRVTQSNWNKEDLTMNEKKLLSSSKNLAARSKSFNIWAKYQNQGKGLEFVKKSLIAELEELNND